MKGKIRVIAGQWRGRKLQVPNKLGLRPTPARVRETLFNWLAIDLPGSRCLDLFAGSGILGIEAASRGAKQVVFVEKEYDIVQNLRQQVAPLACHNLKILCTDAMRFLKGTPENFDLVFLDPPYGDHLLTPCCIQLEQGGWLTSEALIYVEVARRLKEPAFPSSWQIIRRLLAGQVMALLAIRHPDR